MNERQYRDQRQKQQDDIDYQEGVDAYHRGWEDHEAGRPDLSEQDSTGHYAAGWEDHEQEMAKLAVEAERGYCTEHIGGGHYCGQLAVAKLEPSSAVPAGLVCKQHVRGWPEAVLTRFPDTVELRDKFARQDEVRAGAARELADELPTGRLRINPDPMDVL